MDADMEPVPCRDCGTPTYPNMGWCQDCDEKHRAEMYVWVVSSYDEIIGVFDNEEAARLCESEDDNLWFKERRLVRSSWTPGEYERFLSGEGDGLP